MDENWHKLIKSVNWVKIDKNEWKRSKMDDNFLVWESWAKMGKYHLCWPKALKKIQILTNNCTPLHTELLSEPIREPGEVSVRANFQFQLSFDIAASREKLREASENNSFKTASSVSAAPGPHNHWISEPRHYECLFKSNWVDWNFAFSSHNNSCPTI